MLLGYRTIFSLIMFVASYWASQIPLILVIIPYLWHALITKVPQTNVIIGTCLAYQVVPGAMVYVSLAAFVNRMYYVGVLCLISDISWLIRWELRRQSFKLINRAGPAVCFYTKILKEAGPEFVIVLFCIAMLTDYLCYKRLPTLILR